MAVYQCRGCGYEAPDAWEDECPSCRNFYRIRKLGVDSKDQKRRSTFAAAAEFKRDYIPTGVKGFDETIGGGLVAGSPILLGGYKGAGKSTLLCMVADAVARAKGRACYASSEESEDGVISIASRLKLANDDVEVLGNQLIVERVIEHVRKTRPFLTIYDSLQKFMSEKSGGTPGSIAQEQMVSSAILAHCRETKTCAIVVNQMAKGGDLKGSTDAPHMVDTVLVLGYPKDDDEDAPLEDRDKLRILSVEGKNRNGDENAKTYWVMQGKDDPNPGTLVHVPPRSKLVEEPRRGYRRG